jgi:hypothetical protein
MPSQPEPYGSSRRLSRQRAACQAASRTGERLGGFRWRGRQQGRRAPSMEKAVGFPILSH